MMARVRYIRWQPPHYKEKYVNLVAKQVIYLLFSHPYFVEKNVGIDMIYIKTLSFSLRKTGPKNGEQMICLTTKPAQWL